MMREQDKTIFEYRRSKEVQNTDAIVEERLHGVFTRHSVRTPSAGYVDIAIYRPLDATEEEVLPAVFSFHGGGFVLGYFETDGHYCRRLADATHTAVINVDYVLAPEFKYPLPILSSYEAVAAVRRRAKEWHLDPDKFMVMGHSSGGAIAADLCLLDRERGEVSIKGQIIDYAPLRQSLNDEDRKALDPALAIKKSRMLEYIQWYFSDLSQMEEELASPLLADLHDLPPMLVISAAYDSLCGEEKAFADKARQSGVDVTYHRFEGCRHGFTHQEFKNEYRPAEAEQAWEMMAAFIRRIVG